MSNNSSDEVFQEQVIRAAQKLFRQHGMYKVTMDDVARAVGKGRSSLYYYYKSKEEILDAVMDVEISEILGLITQAVDKETTVEGKICAFCTAKLLALQKRRELYKTVDMENDPDELVYRARAGNAIRKRMIEQEGALFGQILLFGVSKGELRRLNQKDQEILIFVLLSGLRGLVKEMAFENEENLEPAIRTLSHMIVHGLKK
ncbi:MAG TPA: TetR/AcrR family transcriptional regulator [Puia sp.]|jgi:AcrR family transcriptional regulator